MLRNGVAYGYVDGWRDEGERPGGGRRRGRREIERGLFYNANMRGESIEEERMAGWRLDGERI